MEQEQPLPDDGRAPDGLIRPSSISERAPLLIPVALWSAGIVLARVLAPVLPPWVWVALLLPAVLAGLFLKRFRPWLVLVCCLLAGAARWSASDPSNRPLRAILAQRDKIRQMTEFRVTDVLSTTSGAYGICSEKIAGARVKERLLLFTQEALQPGERYQALLEILPITDDPVLDIFPNRYSGRAYILMSLQKTGGKIQSLHPDAIRHNLLKRLDDHAGEASSAAKALLLSDTSAKREYRDRLQRGGMMHLIVVSGLHVWFIYAILIVLLRGILPRRAADVAFLLLICLFAALNHWAAPIARSVLMIAVVILARWRGVPVAPAQMLAFSLFVITALAPAELFSAGLQLSFVCVGVILFALPKRPSRALADWKKPWLRLQMERLSGYLVLTMLVSIAILPLTLFYFGQGTLNGILGNALGVPLTGLLLPASFLVLIFPPGNIIGNAFLAAYKLLLWLFELWMSFCGSLPLFFSGWYLSLPQSIGLALLILPVLTRPRRYTPHRLVKILLPVGLGCLLLALPALIKSKHGEILVFNAGTADCTLIRLPGGETIMIDTGPGASGYETEKDPSAVLDTDVWASKRLLPWLNRNGIKRIDHLILTHTHSDHIGGFAALASRLQVARVFASDDFLRSPVWATLSSQKWLQGTRITPVADTMDISIGDANLHFLHPDGHWNTDSENDRSIVTRLDVMGKSYLFAADIQTPAEEYLVQNHPDALDADYLKAPHHGSKGSNSADFLAAVSPWEIWVTCSARNVYGFPHQEAMEVFRRHTGRIRLSYEGTIRVKL